MARPTLFTHRKFRKLSLMLRSPALALGSLEFIWAAGYQSGDALLGCAEVVEDIAHWRGRRGALVAALVECGFLDVSGDEYRIHDLDAHAPAYVAKRRRREQLRAQRTSTDQSLTSQMPDTVRPLTPTPSPSPSPSPSPPLYVPPKRGDVTYPKEFIRFWDLYPRKVRKIAAVSSWRRKVRDGTAEKIFKALEWQTKSQGWQEGYIPLPATYLNQGRWDDEPPRDALMEAEQ